MPSETPFPLMPPKSTELRMEHFDEPVYSATPDTILYKFIDAICGDAGAGSLKKEIFMQRLSGAITGIYGSDLDYIFGNMHFLSRAPSEGYPYNTMTQMLTADQWNEVRVKDQWYRNRITEFFQACTSGGTTDGIRQAVHAACSVDCEIFETWRYMDNFGLIDNLGRSPVAVRNEVVIKPYKATLEPQERRLLRDMLDKIMPQDSVATIDTNGLAVSSPVPIRSITADSNYYQVEKVVTPSPILADMPAPELLAIDLDPSEQWLFTNSAELAPYAQFNITQEYGYYYLVSGGTRSPIDSVSYGVLREDGNVYPEPAFVWYEPTGQFTAWTAYEKADSPDNYPGGKFGIHPATAPALNPDQSPYQFKYFSQESYVAIKKAEVIAAGGYADDQRYRLPIQQAGTAKRTYNAELAIAYSAPIQDSTITSSWTARKPRQNILEWRNHSMFVRL